MIVMLSLKFIGLVLRTLYSFMTRSSGFLHDLAESGNIEGINQLGNLVVGTFQPVTQLAYNVNIRDRENCTPLHCALLSRQLEAASLILNSGANPELGCEGSKPIHIASCMGSVPGNEEYALDAVKLLIAHNADIFGRDDRGRTALHLAVIQPSFLNLVSPQSICRHFMT